MNTDQLQELCETIAIKAMNGGNLAGMVFRHDDTAMKNESDCVIVEADGPVPQLEGPQGFRVEVEIEIRSTTPGKNAIMAALCLQRITNKPALLAAALGAGLTTEDDFYIIDEEISGGRTQTKNMRKRSIKVPFWINPK